MAELRKVRFDQQNKFSKDEINVKLLKNTFNVIVYPLLNCKSSSLNSGLFPDNLKTSIVIPVLKISGTKNIEDFRPINTLSCLDQILELSVYKQFTKYSSSNF